MRFFREAGGLTGVGRVWGKMAASWCRWGFVAFLSGGILGLGAFWQNFPTITFSEYHKQVPFYTVLVQSQYFVLRYCRTM
ncbi:hypothetical protein [Kamptonema formosum]|uniref:hypothetical protein n=2 Tax=Kamptonema formosum TaxID=331992 RepID=UPI00034B7832|nr:hypothetical protein [Oscillatoria sp. PCC 10802]